MAISPMSTSCYLSTSLVACRYVQEADLEFFKERVERETPAPGCGSWELVMSKDFGRGVSYTAWKRHLAVCAPSL